MTRKARLNPEYAELYPEAPSLWIRASAVASVLLRRYRSVNGPDAIPRERILPEGHFSFKGGRRRIRPILSRISDGPRESLPDSRSAP
jgi:hypothetical protein